MKRLQTTLASLCISLLLLGATSANADTTSTPTKTPSNNTAGSVGKVRGIYLTSYTMENSKTIDYLIKRAKETGINTFVVDYDGKNTLYAKNIAKVKEAGIHYVARVVIFPNGGVNTQIRSPEYWAQKYQLMKEAIALGANAIQLDYIRYKPSQPASQQNVKDISEVIAWFKQHLAKDNIPMQVDVFGETSYIPSMHIGQDIKAIAANIDVLCPMVYPSHYDPHTYHTQHPYETIYNSLTSLQKKFDNNPPFQINPYIEVRNFRVKSQSYEERVAYLQAELRAVRDAKAHGWYAWSANNKYDLLFDVLSKKLPATPVAESSNAKTTSNKSDKVS